MSTFIYVDTIMPNPWGQSQTRLNDRLRLIASLLDEEPQLHASFRNAVRTAEGESAFLRISARFPLCGRGDINSYAVFAETFYTIARRESGCGLIVPSGILADDTTKLFFKEIQQSRALAQAIDFENNETLFPGVGHGRMRFCLLTLRKGNAVDAARLFFLARGVADLMEHDRWFNLGPSDAATINPNSETCPVFLSRRDAELTRAAYLRFPILRGEDGEVNPWQARLHRLFDMTLDGDMLRTAQTLLVEGWVQNGREFVRGNAKMLPIIEGKMVTFYDHRSAHIRLNPDAPSRQQQTEDTTDQEKESPGFFPNAYLWAPADESLKRFHTAAGQSWAIGFKRVTSATNWRTLVACIVPDSLAISYTLYVLGIGEEYRTEQHCLLATLNSFAYDYFVRQKTMQPSLPIGPVYETIIPPPESFSTTPSWSTMSLSRWIAERVGELVCVSSDLVDFARATLGREVVFEWRPSRRELLQAELDAAIFHHFAMSRQDVEHVLSTFSKVRDYDQRLHGEFRTARMILSIFDEMAAIARTGKAYQTRLDPPPADPSIAHRTPGLALPAMPSVIPQLQPAEETAIVIWALLHAAGGTLARTDLARAFVLRARPELLKRLAPASVPQASEWATKVGSRAVAQGLLATTLSALMDRGGVALGTNSDSRATVSMTPNTPMADRLDPWFRFEAQLALQVLRGQPATAFRTIDDSLAGDDRTLIEQVKQAS